MASFRFRRLPRYFSPELLNTASVVITHPLPVPPLTAMGLTEFAAFERQPMGGITYLDTYFLLPGGANDESLHFHELVHVIQWRVLGLENFLSLYAAGLAERGIRTAHWRRWHTDTSIDSTFGGRRTRSKRTSRRRRWRWRSNSWLALRQPNGSSRHPVQAA